MNKNNSSLNKGQIEETSFSQSVSGTKRNENKEIIEKSIESPKTAERPSSFVSQIPRSCFSPSFLNRSKHMVQNVPKTPIKDSKCVNNPSIENKAGSSQSVETSQYPDDSRPCNSRYKLVKTSPTSDRYKIIDTQKATESKNALTAKFIYEPGPFGRLPPLEYPSMFPCVHSFIIDPSTNCYVNSNHIKEDYFTIENKKL